MEIALVWILKVNFYKLYFLGLRDHTVLLPFFFLSCPPRVGSIVCLLSLSTALENLYPSKVWIVVGNIFQTVFQGSCHWPTAEVFVLHFES